MDVCVRMMEKVHHVPTTVTAGNHQGEDEVSTSRHVDIVIIIMQQGLDLSR